ncbi:MAG TPA: AI-2E family transporter [Candidatus Paceibacterota bacterium]|nr:AI-2E family transporter [Candidatus Paceibacterota bacterium]
MDKARPRLYFLLILLSITAILAFFILRPFLLALVLAVVFAIVCQPLYLFILKKFRGRVGLASLATILLLLVFIFVPLFFLGWQILEEGQLFYAFLSDNFSSTSLASWSRLVEQSLTDLSPAFGNLSIDLNLYLERSLNFFLNNLATIFFNLTKVITDLFVFLFALYYLLKDGDKLKSALIKISPLTKSDDEVILTKITLAVNSVIKGSLLLALIQGLISAFGFVLFGVPNPFLWGTVALAGSLVPAVGTAIVIIPAVIFLYFKGQVVASLGLLLWGGVFVGLSDNLLRPYLVGKGSHLHPLIVLLSVLGGLSFFGPTGFILGPLIAVLLLVLLDISSSFIVKSTC